MRNRIGLTVTHLATPVVASAASGAVLIENVRIFDGVDPELRPGHVLVDGDVISRVSEEVLEAPEGARVIDGAGRILSPGFIDLHAHLTLGLHRQEFEVRSMVVGAKTVEAARHYLMSGFATVRDTAGIHPDIARAVERGWLEGSSIYASIPGVVGRGATPRDGMHRRSNAA
jgi:imidazolonepropionase-like amidohydrolase